MTDAVECQALASDLETRWDKSQRHSLHGRAIYLAVDELREITVALRRPGVAQGAMRDGDAVHFGNILRDEAARLRARADELDPPSAPLPEGKRKDPAPLVVEALTIAEDVLSRSPYSTAIWPNGMHPQTGIEKIRAALASLSSTQSESDRGIVEAARFLVDRLEEFDPGDDEPEREYHGHVAPALARLRSALSSTERR